ncbi:MAG: hypothetical protein CBD95_002045 [Flavobacteriales bacterium TMED235]|nr:MAG: hypothetical protein CBD95_002045 [Flavobacteriales bacterium TMED235]
MNHENFNISMRKFLKKVGVTSQQKIEESVRLGIENGRIASDELQVKVTLKIDDLGLSHEIDGEIQLGKTK